ncbi:hypothetical protein L7F22_032862 [Adiantum nelumboides]|nr:hypothetical protein [Adiantum nelumboides]
MQKDHETSYMRPIYFSSRMMTGPEKGYTPVEHMVLALMFDTQKFRPYLLPKKFVILTVEEVVPYVLQHMDVSSCISKWLIRLQEFEYTVQVESSTRASLAGILTHRHFEKKVKSQGEEVLPPPEPQLGGLLLKPSSKHLSELIGSPPPPPIADPRWKRKRAPSRFLIQNFGRSLLLKFAKTLIHVMEPTDSSALAKCGRSRTS